MTIDCHPPFWRGATDCFDALELAHLLFSGRHLPLFRSCPIFRLNYKRSGKAAFAQDRFRVLSKSKQSLLKGTKNYLIWKGISLEGYYFARLI